MLTELALPLMVGSGRKEVNPFGGSRLSVGDRLEGLDDAWQA